MKTGIEQILEERARQISQEGWSPEHDDAHQDGELTTASECYIEVARRQLHGADFKRMVEPLPMQWPWEAKWWKPSHDVQRNLVKGAALLAAEIDRLNRLRLHEHLR